MQIEITPSKEINDKSALIKALDNGGILIEDLGVIFLSSTSIEEWYGNMMCAECEGYDVLKSEEFNIIYNISHYNITRNND